MRLYHAVYFSTKAPEADSQLPAILDVAKRNNTAIGITGILLTNEKHYFQVLEGHRTELSIILATIIEDPRHTDVTVVLVDDIEKRSFADWSMAHIDLDDPDLMDRHNAHISGLRYPKLTPGRAIYDALHAIAEDPLIQAEARTGGLDDEQREAS